MKAKPIFLATLTCFTLALNSCKEDQDPTYGTGDTATARILSSTCRGVVMQVIQPANLGVAWKNLSDVTFPNCVLVSHVPENAQTTGDTITFTHIPGLGPGNYCDLGGLPKVEVRCTSVK